MWTRKYSILARKYKTATSSQLVDRNKHNINAVMTCYIYPFFAHKTKAGACLHCTRGKNKNVPHLRFPALLTTLTPTEWAMSNNSSLDPACNTYIPENDKVLSEQRGSSNQVRPLVQPSRSPARSAALEFSFRIN